MKIRGWYCVSSNDGSSRGATHPENGTITWLNGRIIGACDAPREVVEWLIRPSLRSAWARGHSQGPAGKANPWAGEPPNKDNAPS